MDTVAAGFGANIDDWIADARRRRIENLVGIGDTHRHRVDKDVAIIGGMEVGFAANRRNADAIAIATNAGNDALHQMLHLGVIRPSKTQRVHVGNRTRTHGEDVAQDAANASRRALIRLDIRRVVVALHLEDRRLPVTNVDDARIFAGAADYPRRFCRQLFQMDARAFVAAMLRPHHREYAEFDKVGLTP